MLVGDFASLEVRGISRDGALLDWGRSRDLLLPREEQIGRVFEGDAVVVYITQDRRQSPMATMRVREHLEHDPSELEPNQRVDLLVFGVSGLGFDCIIDQKHLGVLYHNEVFSEIACGSRLTGYVKKIRDDGKIDLMTQLRGIDGTPDLAENILRELKSMDGFLALTDKSEPEEIYSRFGVSKKKFKVALGDLYKRRKVSLDEDGIRLLT